MDEVGPFTLFVIFLKCLLLPVVLAWGTMWLCRRKYGGLGGADWFVLFAAGGVACLALFISDSVQARYLDQVGSAGEGTVTRKWLVEGDDSVTFKVAVRFKNYEGEFEVSEGYYDLVAPPTKTKVIYDPEYASDFVPEVAVRESPELWVLIGMLISTAIVLSATVGWVLLRAKQHFTTSS